MTKLTRRRLLASTGIAMTGLAGCSGGSPADSGNETGPTDMSTKQDSAGTGDSDVLAGVETTADDEEVFLRVEWREDAELDRINLLGPDGTSVNSASVTPRQTAAEFPIADEFQDPIAPGEYEVVAIRDDAEVDVVQTELSRELEVNNLTIVEQKEAPAKFSAEVANTGDFPILSSYFSAPDGVPSPTDPEEWGDIQRMAAFKRDGERFDTLMPGEEATMLDTTDPLLATDLSCNGDQRETTLVFQSKNGFTKEIDVTYRLEGEASRLQVDTRYGCNEGEVLDIQK